MQGRFYPALSLQLPHSACTFTSYHFSASFLCSGIKVDTHSAFWIRSREFSREIVGESRPPNLHRRQRQLHASVLEICDTRIFLDFFHVHHASVPVGVEEVVDLGGVRGRAAQEDSTSSGINLHIHRHVANEVSGVVAEMGGVGQLS